MGTIYASKRDQREESWKKEARLRFEKDRAEAFWRRAVPMMCSAAYRGRIRREEQEYGICRAS
jgi:hypothetical protein